MPSGSGVLRAVSLQPHGQGADCRAEGDHRRHLHHIVRRAGRHHPAHLRSLPDGQLRPEFPDVPARLLGCPARDLALRPGSGQGLGEHLRELAGPPGASSLVLVPRGPGRRGRIRLSGSLPVRPGRDRAAMLIRPVPGSAPGPWPGRVPAGWSPAARRHRAGRCRGPPAAPRRQHQAAAAGPRAGWATGSAAARSRPAGWLVPGLRGAAAWACARPRPDPVPPRRPVRARASGSPPASVRAAVPGLLRGAVSAA